MGEKAIALTASLVRLSVGGELRDGTSSPPSFGRSSPIEPATCGKCVDLSPLHFNSGFTVRHILWSFAP